MGRVWFGLRVDESIETAWGARAIPTRYGIDFVWDRMQNRGEAQALCGWIDADVRPLLNDTYLGRVEPSGWDAFQALAHENRADPKIVAMDTGDHHFRAVNKGGYLYMCAFVGDEAQAQAWDEADGRSIVRLAKEG